MSRQKENWMEYRNLEQWWRDHQWGQRVWVGRVGLDANYDNIRDAELEASGGSVDSAELEGGNDNIHERGGEGRGRSGDDVDIRSTERQGEAKA
ncbi:hypothetical protein GUJ93_ZPchr0006g41697 [Zizania palustris]|uniref:Uncharacterized protein n=1 Tax=Zizania palustris TaxID=103762 RepID=A0A8J5SJR0_ZIZPA|nr:hypothetical protein GUJ93_ZPchr0006g41697 [Zizania palustris]